MQDQASIKIKERAFQSFDFLLLRGKVKNVSWFCEEYKFDKRNFYRSRRVPQHAIELSFLTILVEYGVSAKWLLTGKGEMFSERSLRSIATEQRI